MNINEEFRQNISADICPQCGNFKENCFCTKNEIPNINLSEEEKPIEGISLKEVPFAGDKRTALELEYGTPLFINEGLIGVQLDQERISQILRDEGIDQSRINELQIKFVAGRLKNRVAQNRLVAGEHHIAHGRIELYTSFRLNSDRTKVVQAPIKPVNLARNLAHELKHYIQECNGENMVPTLGLSEEEYLSDQHEVEAIEYSNKHLEEFQQIINCSSSVTGESFSAMADNEYPVLNQYCDVENAFVTYEKDNPVIYWEEKINQLVNNRDQYSRQDLYLRFNQISVDGMKLVESGDLGLLEFQAMENTLNSSLFVK